MNVLVFGLGALGTVYSCLLKKDGHRVAGVAYESMVDEIRENGVSVTGIWGDHHTLLDEVVSGLEKLHNRHFDLAVVTVKTFDTATAAGELAAVLPENTHVILAQNGYGNFEEASRFLAEDRIILGRVIFGAETLAPGHSKVTVIADDVILGSPGNLVPLNILEDYAALFRKAGIPTRASGEVMKYIWGKILYNAPLNTLGAVFEVNYGKLGEVEETRFLIEGVIREIFNVLKALGQETLWPSADIYLEEFFGKLLPLTGAHHASMLQDIRNGRRTEIDSLNGAVADLGKKYGVATPVNEFITLMVKAKEKLAPSSSR